MNIIIFLKPLQRYFFSTVIIDDHFYYFIYIILNNIKFWKKQDDNETESDGDEEFKLGLKANPEVAKKRTENDYDIHKICQVRKFLI